MSTIEEKTQGITVPGIARRIRHELQKMKNIGIFCDDADISITKYFDRDFHIIIKNAKDKRLYKFIIPPNYPFSPPRLELNYKPYSSYLRFQSEKFTKLFYKHKGYKCFCCESVLCPDNWGPEITLSKIMDEVNAFHKECREIADIVFVNVIKRKYLIDDINILEWLY